MNDTRNVRQELQAEILKTARKGQEAVVGAIKTWTGTVRSITPPQKELSLPFADRLPKPEELAGNAYEFAQKLLASQRKFAEGVLHAATPMLPRSGGAGPKTGTARKTGAGPKTGTARKTGTGPKTDTGRKSGPAGQKNGSTGR
jgi:hypothetical protein